MGASSLESHAALAAASFMKRTGAERAADGRSRERVHVEREACDQAGQHWAWEIERSESGESVTRVGAQKLR